jgi:hypothetical protein
MPRQSTILICMGLLLMAPGAAGAGDWQMAADLGLALTQSGYSDSWTGGESGSINWTSTGNVSAQKILSPKAEWKNTLKLQYGQNHIQDPETNDWAPPEKSKDRIFMESLMRFTLNKAADPYAAVTLETQFADDSDPAEDRYIFPRLFSESAGIGRMLIEEEKNELFSRVGFAVRHRSYFDGGTALTTTATDGGLEWVTDHKQVFSEDKLEVVSKLRVFQAFMNSESDDLGDDWETTDVTLESTLSVTVTGHIMVKLFVEFLYDKEISYKGRFRESLGLGLSYKLF